MKVVPLQKAVDPDSIELPTEPAVADEQGNGVGYAARETWLWEALRLIQTRYTFKGEHILAGLDNVKLAVGHVGAKNIVEVTARAQSTDNHAEIVVSRKIDDPLTAVCGLFWGALEALLRDRAAEGKPAIVDRTEGAVGAFVQEHILPGLGDYPHAGVSQYKAGERSTVFTKEGRRRTKRADQEGVYTLHQCPNVDCKITARTTKKWSGALLMCAGLKGSEHKPVRMTLERPKKPKKPKKGKG